MGGRWRDGGRTFAGGLSWPLLAAAAAFLLLLPHGEQLMRDGDVYFHVAIGRWIIEHGAVPAFDVFSYPLRDAPWTAHEWLAEVLFACAYRFAGWHGVVALAVAAFAGALGILNRFLLRHMEPIYALFFTAMAGSLLAFHLLARPHALVEPLLVGWGIALVNASDRGKAPRWWVALAMMLWANLHGSFVLGLMLVPAFAAEAWLAAAPGASQRRVLKAWSAFLALAVLAAMATPFGPAGLMFAVELDRMPFAMSMIAEWRSLNFQVLQPVEISLMIAAAAILARGLRLPSVRLVLVLLLLHLTLKHARHADLLALLAPVFVAGPFAAQWFAGREAARQLAAVDRVFASLARPAGTATTAAVFALLAAAAWVLAQAKPVRPSGGLTPEAAVQAAHAGGARGPVLNAYEFGGYLIYIGTPPFIDGRADLYGDRFLERYAHTVNLSKPDLLPQILDSYRIGWTLLVPGMPAIAVLDRLPGWRRLYADKVAVVHLRDPGAGLHGVTKNP